MRLISLTKVVGVEARNESVWDTILDVQNYSVFLYALWDEERKEFVYKNTASERAAKWLKDNPTKRKMTNAARNGRYRRALFEAYGGPRCASCGFSDERALQIDHVAGGGSQMTRLLKMRGTGFYTWLRRNDYPPGFQVLCANCNWIKRHQEQQYNPKGAWKE